MTNVPDTVGKQARDVLVTVPDGHHGQDYLRSVNSTTTGAQFSSTRNESIRPPSNPREFAISEGIEI